MKICGGVPFHFSFEVFPLDMIRLFYLFLSEGFFISGLLPPFLPCFLLSSSMTETALSVWVTLAEQQTPFISL